MNAGSANLNVMIKAARRAARGLVRDFGEVENLQVSMKGAGDFVSKADLKAEETIKDVLMEARPAYGFLAEEGGESEAGDGMHRWIVDPLDGTTNFLHGLPHWAVSIALERKGELIAAVIYDPVKDELFSAEKGQGAWMNDRRLRVSKRRDFLESIFSTGVPFANSPHLPKALKEYAVLMPRCAGLRRFGAAALDLAYVAAGRYEAFWERGIQPWDVAAGLLLVKEAGGLIGPLDGVENPMMDGALIAANADIFEPFSKLLAEV